METKKAGPPRKYVKRANTSLSLESDVLDEVRASGLSITHIFMKGWEIVLPSNISGYDLKRRELERDKVKLQAEMESLKFDIDTIDREIVALDKTMTEVRVDVKDTEDKRIEIMRKLWPEYRKKVKVKPYNWKENDPEIVVWWETRGVTISFGELIAVWDELEALNG